MADNIPFGSSGGGSFVPYTPITSINVPSGSSGDIIDITPAPGNTLRVLLLSAANVTREAGMTVSVDNSIGSASLLTNGLLDNTQPTGGFCIGNYSFGNLSHSENNLVFVDCSGITVTKVTGNTSTSIQCSYIEGRFE